MAVVFAMPASYILSRTVVPTMVNFLLKGEHHIENSEESKLNRRNWFARIHEGFNHGFEKVRTFYVARLDWTLRHARIAVGVSLAFVVLSLGFLMPFLGEDFFPLVDAGQFRLHVRAPVGTRIEETQHVFTEVENVIRSVIPKNYTFLVQPSDIVGQILNAGLPAPIDVQVVGGDREKNYQIAQQLRQQIAQVPGAVDVNVH